MDIQIMRSTNILFNNNETYKNFFQNNNIVISSTNVLSRWPWIWHWINKFIIKQKIPTKTYCWINEDNTWKIEFDDCFNFDSTKNEFYKTSFSQSIEKINKIKKIIWNFLSNNNFKKWLKFSFLAENPSWHWFSFYSVSSCLISLWVHILLWKINSNILENNTIENSHELSEIYFLWWEISKYLSNWDSSWSTHYVCISKNSFPILYMNKINQDNEDEYNDYNIEILKQKKIRYNDLNVDKFDLWKFLNNWEKLNNLPIDYWVLNFWIKYNYDQNKFITKWFLDEFNELQEFIVDIFKENKIENIQEYQFYQSFDTNMKKNLTNIMYIQYLKILKWFHWMIRYQFNEKRIEEFIEIINSTWIMQSLLEKNNFLLSEILIKFEKLKLYKDEQIWLMPLNTWKSWWSILFVTKFWKSRETLGKTIENLIKNWYDNLFLEYCSYRDWFCDDWLKIEQYLSNWDFSNFVKKDDVILIKNWKQKNIVSYITFLKEYKTWILFDKIKNKIYINWIKINSKDIHSQTIAIELFDVLIENLWNEIFSKNLTYSSYTKNKNEMLWKILMPFKKLLIDKYNINLEIECMWSLTEYYVKLKKLPDIDIFIVKNFY